MTEATEALSVEERAERTLSQVESLLDEFGTLASSADTLVTRASALAEAVKEKGGTLRDVQAIVKATVEEAKAVHLPRAPEQRRGIAINVRYGFIPDEDERRGPSLRMDVNADGRWTLTRLAGRDLGRFLREERITDIKYLEGRVVEVVEDEDLAWKLHRLVPADEEKAEIAATLEALEHEVEHVDTASFGRVPVGTRFTVLDGSHEGRTITVKGRKPGASYGFAVEEDDSMWSGLSTYLKLIEPLATDRFGHPLYEGDHVEAVYHDGSPIRGLIYPELSEGWAILRDDGREGGGSYVTASSGQEKKTWLMGSQKKTVVKLAPTEEKVWLATDRFGRELYEGDRVEVTREHGGNHKVTGSVHREEDSSLVWSLLRDDGTEGDGVEVGSRRCWLLDSTERATAVKLTGDVLLTNSAGDPICHGDRVTLWSSENEEQITGIVVATDTVPAVMREDGEKGSGPGGSWSMFSHQDDWLAAIILAPGAAVPTIEAPDPEFEEDEPEEDPDDEE